MYITIMYCRLYAYNACRWAVVFVSHQNSTLDHSILRGSTVSLELFRGG